MYSPSGFETSAADELGCLPSAVEQEAEAEWGEVGGSHSGTVDMEPEAESRVVMMLMTSF